jgi:hypothetical protein
VAQVIAFARDIDARMGIEAISVQWANDASLRIYTGIRQAGARVRAGIGKSEKFILSPTHANFSALHTYNGNVVGGKIKFVGMLRYFDGAAQG